MTAEKLHPDRALPAEPATRAAAREIYAATRDLPLLCMHGHVDAALLADDSPFPDPASLFVTPDHYLTRMLVSQGVPMEALGIPGSGDTPVERDPRAIWRRFCENWHLFRGTPTRFWLEYELLEVLGVSGLPSAQNADALYDEIAARLAEPEFRPRALFERFRIEVLATTDPALSPLDDHARIKADPWPGEVIPTFRPDALLYVDSPNWRADIDALAEMTGVDTGSYRGFVEALRLRRQAFAEAGALATDHGHATADTTRLSDAQAARLYADALAGEHDPEGVAAFAGHMLNVMAEMSCEDGLVMQIHPGVLRDHDPAVRASYGPDRGFDIPVAAEFTRSLRPLLASYGRDPRLRVIVYTVDETVYSRELAPLAGVYPALLLGAPWWFLDSPDGLRRFREAVTETAGFYNTAGFVDDTRAFLSIPARHDLARRIDAGYLARLVTEHRLSLEEAVETAVDLAYRLPRRVFRRA
ncbi:glucuronate isomerase [Thermostaphylospora chromogena]|uniref:Uronate isomerase n=1 Tax=Thermostaphylospora chromogena TaxID=35622 RepID=A0A1H1HS42_9ACTN|nr:glucuronate isomerase [Thermostaphylospora chromogena]SDR28290.1 glucuronate isomerase [Thermostaphylospora chromogena]